MNWNEAIQKIEEERRDEKARSLHPVDRHARERMDRMTRLCAALLEDLRHRVEDRADSSLPEWEREAKDLGVPIA